MTENCLADGMHHVVNCYKIDTDEPRAAKLWVEIST